MKKILLIFFLYSYFSSGQTPVVAWDKTLGGSVNEVLQNITQTLDGGFIIGGFSNSYVSGDKTIPTFGSYDCWIIKTDELGNIEWQKTYGGTDIEESFEILKTSDNGYLLAVSSRSNISGNKIDNSKGFDDYWILKLDANGTILWQKTIGGNAGDLPRSIIETPDGGYLIGGISYSNANGDKSENNIGGTNGTADYWLVKIDYIGNIEWQNTIGSTSDDKLEAVLNANDGGYIVSGYSNGPISADKTEASVGDYDCWIIKIDSTGSIEWQKTIGGNQKEQLTSMIATEDGNYVFGAISDSNISGNKTQNSKGLQDFWLIKIDSNGNMLWDKTIGGQGQEGFFNVYEDNNQNLYIGGTSNSNISGDKTENSKGNYDYWIVKTDSSGDILWDKTIGGLNDEFLYSMLYKVSDDSLILGGPSKSNISGDKTQNSRGEYDYWVVKLTSENLATNNLFVNNIKLYPNPTKKTITLDFIEKYENIEITVTNILGQIVQKLNFNTISSIDLDLNDEKGIYFVKILSENNEKIIFKVIKE